MAGKRAHRQAANGRGTLTVPARSLLKEQAYAEIKQFILRGDLTSGTFLVERQLAKQLAMSKTPVRAALERLEAEGFVSVSPQQGIVIRELTVPEIADQYEIRAALESYVLRAVAGKLTADQVARLRANLQKQALLHDAPDVERGVMLDAEFHLLFSTFLGNAEIQRVMSQLRERMHRVIMRVFQHNPQRIGTSYEEHCAIAEAVYGGDGAAELLERHLEVGKQFLFSPRRG